MADPQSGSDLDDLLAVYGRDVVRQQAGLDQNTVAFDMPMEEEYEIPMAKDRLARPIRMERGEAGLDKVAVQLGTTGGIGAYSDLGARPAGKGRPVLEGNTTRSLIAASLKFGLEELDFVDGNGSGGNRAVNKRLATLRAFGSGVGAFFARAVIDRTVDEPTADLTAAATSMTVQDDGGYIEGMTYEVRIVATGVLKGTFTVAAIAINLDGTATVTFENALGFALDVSEEAIYLLGQGDSNKRLGDLTQVVTTGDMYGLDDATEFPVGTQEDVSGAWSNEDGKRACALLRKYTVGPTHWYGGPDAIDKIIFAQGDNVRFIAGNGTLDPFDDVSPEGVPAFNGLPMVVCPRGGSQTSIFLGNFEDCYLREHAAFKPRKAASGRGTMGSEDTFLNSTDEFAVKVNFDGWYSFICTKRRSFFEFINVTA